MFDFLDDTATRSIMDMQFREDEIIYIDSNIFMDERTDFFFSSLDENNKVFIPRVQYNELYKLKSSDEGGKAKRARDAFRKIEELFDKKIITIEDLSGKNKETYADEAFIKLILEDLKNSKKVAFITDDRDLRLRLKIEVDKNENYNELFKLYTLDNIEERKVTRRLETSALKKVGKGLVGVVGIGVAIFASGE